VNNYTRITWQQLEARKKVGKVKELTVTPEEWEELLCSRETDRRFNVLYDEIGDATIILMTYPEWQVYTVERERGCKPYQRRRPRE